MMPSHLSIPSSFLPSLAHPHPFPLLPRRWHLTRFPAPFHTTSAHGTDGGLPKVIGSFTYSQKNLLNRNQKLNASIDIGQAESMFRLSHHDPWVRSDPFRTSRTCSLMNTRSTGSAIHGKACGALLSVPGQAGHCRHLGLRGPLCRILICSKCLAICSLPRSLYPLQLRFPFRSGRHMVIH